MAGAQRGGRSDLDAPGGLLAREANISRSAGNRSTAVCGSSLMASSSDVRKVEKISLAAV